VYEAKQTALYLLAKELGVSEAWLMGYDVPMDRNALHPTEESLTEGERALLDLFRLVPTEKQEMVVEMIRVALGKKG
jgi:hypothetical protein